MRRYRFDSWFRPVAVTYLMYCLAGCAPTSAPSSGEVASEPGQATEFTPAPMLRPAQDSILRAPGSFLLAVDPGEDLDSIVAYWDNFRLGQPGPAPYRVQTDSLPVGVHMLRVVSWRDGRSREHSRRMELLPRDAPRRYVARRVAEYPHSRQSYTQGLLVHSGRMYESTGQRGQSTLRRVNLRTGEAEQLLSLSPAYFAEGLAYHNGQLYQLTWTSGRLIVYDEESFRELRTMEYSTQGWGLECDGEHFFMSDGSQNIYVQDLENFHTVRTLQVYDEDGPVNYLNELEFIGDLLYANVYMTDEIVGINPWTGAVEARIDLTGLLPASLHAPGTDVLNGIAHDRATGQIFVTGKNWPRLYEVEFVLAP